jgi:CRP/FNR family transcriptional regulator
MKCLTASCFLLWELISKNRPERSSHRKIPIVQRKKQVTLVLILSELYGTDQNEYISVAISRQDIAAYSGTTYETVFICMREIVIEGVIAVSA